MHQFFSDLFAVVGTGVEFVVGSFESLHIVPIATTTKDNPDSSLTEVNHYKNTTGIKKITYSTTEIRN